MPDYKYTAIDRNGAQATGRIDAADDAQARQKLMAKGLMVTTLVADSAGAKPAAAAAPAKAGFSFGAKVTQNDVTVMTRQLATRAACWTRSSIVSRSSAKRPSASRRRSSPRWSTRAS